MYGYNDNPMEQRQFRGGSRFINRGKPYMRPPQESLQQQLQQQSTQHRNSPLPQQKQQSQERLHKQESKDEILNDNMNLKHVVAILKQPKLQMSSASQMQEQNPYTAISISPCRKYAVTASKDMMQIIGISPTGICVIKSINMAQYFQMSSSSSSLGTATTSSSSSSMAAGGGSIIGKSNVGTIMDSSLFSRVDTIPTQASAAVNITDISWSIIPPTHHYTSTRNNSSKTSDYHHNQTSPQRFSHNNKEEFFDCRSEQDDDDWIVDEYDQKSIDSGNNNNIKKTSIHHTKRVAQSAADNSIDSFIAAAGSNGTIVIWKVDKSLLDTVIPLQFGSISTPVNSHHTTQQSNAGDSIGSNTSQPQQQQRLVTPEAVLNHHGREISRLAWHPNKYGLLLSGSQDGTVRLWERKIQEQSTVPTPAVVVTKVQQPVSTRGRTGGTGINSQTNSNNNMFSSFFGSMRPNVPHKHQASDGVDNSNKAPLPVPKKITYQWQSRATYEPKSESVREIRWSPHYDDGMFLLVHVFRRVHIFFTIQ
jgi:WD domain, G-beta repeat